MTSRLVVILLLTAGMIQGCAAPMMALGAEAPAFCLPSPKMKKMPRGAYC